MDDTDQTIAALGNEPPLIADGRSGPPDRREVSARWLSGTFLTGVTSSVLMGVALFAALDGREQLTTPPEIADSIGPSTSGENGEVAKTIRLSPPRQIAKAKDRRRMEVSMVTKVGDRDVVKTMPFVQIKMQLAASHKTTRSYPAFDPLTVFAEDGAADPATGVASQPAGQIYGVKVESEMSLKTVDFPLDTASFDEKSGLSEDEVEKVVRETGSILIDGAVQVAALHYIVPERFGDSLATQALAASYGVRIVPENVSVAPRAPLDEQAVAFAEDIIPFTEDRNIAAAFGDAGYTGPDATGMAEAIGKLFGSTALKAGTVLRVGLEVRGDAAKVVRTSVYDHTKHLRSIALDDSGQFVPATEPEPNPELLTAFDDSPPVQVRGNLPSIYDSIYRTAYSYNMSKSMTEKLIKLLASDVDFQSRVGPTDRLEVFFSQPGDDDQMSDESELLYVSATFGGNTRNLYRFQMEDGGFDYFDEDGKSSKQFLLRTPLPNGKFRSGFGARSHPILGYVKMHTGVDWAAPIGSPIIAAGNGVVEKSGWAGGYGKQTILKHANGYETSYNHQSRIADIVKIGARIRQGQVIGYVGTTGLSTGPHLHFEVIVNNRKVDPMRVRLPEGRVLKGDELQAFMRERVRIDELLKEEGGNSLKVAAVESRVTN